MASFKEPKIEGPGAERRLKALNAKFRGAGAEISNAGRARRFSGGRFGLLVLAAMVAAALVYVAMSSFLL